jgi:mitochondrial fission 1 protein
LKESELQVLRSQYIKEQEAQHITIQTKFNYAWGLIKSDVHANQLEGVKLLTGTNSPTIPFLFWRGRLTGEEIYKEAPGRRRECLYYLALGQYKLGHYNEARRYNDSLLEKEPRNMQALSLRALIDDRVAKGTTPLHQNSVSSFVISMMGLGLWLMVIEGYVGMAIVGSAVVGFIAAATMWARRR